MINSYSFGKIMINDQQFTSDLMILPSGKIISWWRKTGHNLVNEDMEKIYTAEPSVIILGTGQMGVMKVSEEIRKYCTDHNIKLVVEPTDKAVESFNNEPTESKAAGLHLTC